MKRICVVTGSRAEYGLLRSLIQGIQESETLDLQLVVTGMHLTPEYGNTVQEIVRDGVPIARQVETLLSSDSGVGVAKSIGVGVLGFADALADLEPDLLVVLGDRFEILAAVLAAVPLTIPVAHIHGGEVTEGSLDDSFRHAISKLSHLHFVAAPEYQRRVVQLGEDPSLVFDVGPLAMDALRQGVRLDRAEVEERLGIPLTTEVLLVTYHPVTSMPGTSVADFAQIISALDAFPTATVILTMPNADAEGQRLRDIAREYASNRENAIAFNSLGQELYLSTMVQADAVIGNSSSGVIEAPIAGVPCINIGVRQQGRLRSPGVFDCRAEEGEIIGCIESVLSHPHRKSPREHLDMYRGTSPTTKILRILEGFEVSGLQPKRFIDF